MNEPLLPVFPLQVVAFPGERLPLHIFEVRYRKMVSDCEALKQPFVIIPIYNDKITRLGTSMEIETLVKRHEDGTLDIITRGTGVVQVQNWRPSPDPEHYHRARVTPLPEDPRCPDDLRERLDELFDVLIDAVQTRKKPQFTGDDQQLPSYRYAPYCGLETEQKIQLLSLRSEAARASFLIQHMADLIKKIEAVARIQERVQQNGHYKVLPGVDFDFTKLS